jgi:hypothetical protein
MALTPEQPTKECRDPVSREIDQEIPTPIPDDLENDMQEKHAGDGDAIRTE